MGKQGRAGGAQDGPNRVDRRESADFWARLFIWVNYLAWAGLMVFLLVFHRAQPEFETFFDKFYQLNLRTYWDKTFIRYLVYIAGAGLAATTAGLGLSLFRARRHTDHRKPIVILGVLYLILIILSWLLL
ncbi:MAG: hypothetical protein HUN04_26325 [Desulfobacter sp.]|nr:MAG: hypothetical protein HUN04_26325 [Desulfobacter sp.]